MVWKLTALYWPLCASVCVFLCNWYSLFDSQVHMSDINVKLLSSYSFNGLPKLKHRMLASSFYFVSKWFPKVMVASFVEWEPLHTNPQGDDCFSCRVEPLFTNLIHLPLLSPYFLLDLIILNTITQHEKNNMNMIYIYINMLKLYR